MEAASAIGSSRFVEYQLIEKNSRVIVYEPQIFYSESNDNVRKVRQEAILNIALSSMLECVSNMV